MATTAARLALYDILQKSHELHPSTTTAQWADDLAERTQSTPSEVVSKAVEAALQLVWDLQEEQTGGCFQVSGHCNHIAYRLTGSFFSCKTRHTHPGRQSSQGCWVGCVKRKKADAL